MVCDEKLLLKDRDVFELLIERRWSVVVPHQVFADLSILSKTAQPYSTAAQEALDSVKTAYDRHNDVRILTASGDDITKRHLSSEQSGTCESHLENHDDPGENLIGVTRRATDLASYNKPKEATEEIRSAVLLTEDRPTRVRAAGSKVAALAPSMIRRILARTRMRSLSQSSRISAQEQTSGLGGKPHQSPDPDEMET